MKIYLVGGAVRDKLLNVAVKERDYVVVGATVNDMLAEGYKQVGKDFPVFLHPKTREEYALARKERKVEPGYTGFTFDASPTVTLNDDLKRRDLTINAMAESEEGELIDPYHGQDDLQRKILRHVSEAFAEDPVRILRTGRFLARYYHLGFSIAPETIKLMHDMVTNGEVNALVAERVWKELERALSEKNPEQFFETIKLSGADHILFPGLTAYCVQALISASQLTEDPQVRFAALMHDYYQKQDKKAGILTFCRRFAVPNVYTELAILTALNYQDALSAALKDAEELLQFLSRLDGFRRENRFKKFLQATRAIAVSKQLAFDPHFLLKANEVAKSVDIAKIIAENLAGPDMAKKLKAARLEKLQDWLKNL